MDRRPVPATVAHHHRHRPGDLRQQPGPAGVTRPPRRRVRRPGEDALAEVTGKAIADRQGEAQRRGLRIDATLGAAPATGDRRLAESLVANLVENALRHNVADGRVEVVTKADGGQAVISVRNTGQPVSAAEVDRLFQRLGGERTGHDGGHGLGLTIVRAIAAAHDAALTANARAEGGLGIEVRFADRGKTG